MLRPVVSQGLGVSEDDEAGVFRVVSARSFNPILAYHVA